MAEPDIRQHLGNIQGNILAGFNKDFQTFLFFQIPDATRGRAWLAATVGDIAAATSDKVLAFNDKFSLARKRLGGRDPAPSGPMKATWVNVAFTHAGLEKLGVSQADLQAFPEEFRDGMAKRAWQLGDVDESAPDRWIEPLRSQAIHGVLMVAADVAAHCEAEAGRQRIGLQRRGLKLLHVQSGMVRQGDQHGREHFGFKDGISQPGIVGLPETINPGPDSVEPGEFVLGHRSERAPAAVPSPAWAADGSYLVFRRLRQDVEAFRDFVSQQATVERITPDLMGAKLVGRYKSGAPLEGARDDPKDPGKKYPTIPDGPRINEFEYGSDPDGRFVPRAAHIRKAYPRDSAARQGGGSSSPPAAPRHSLWRISPRRGSSRQLSSR
jgi:Dyp-type peroxidase family